MEIQNIFKKMLMKAFPALDFVTEKRKTVLLRTVTVLIIAPL